MIIRLTTNGDVVLDTPDDFRRFSVSMPAEAKIDGSALASMMQDDGGTHAWIAPSAVVALHPGEPGTEWQAGFDAMVQYATSKGWVDGQGRLRAHIERT